MRTLFTGPMKSGKSMELLKVAQKLDAHNETYLAFKPKTDTRDINIIKSRCSETPSIPCQMISSPQSIIIILESNPVKNIIIDEVQLFDDEILCVLEFAGELGIDVWAAGLDSNFRGEPFQMGNINTDDLDFEFDDVQELFANCDVCAMPARHTQRLIDGKPAHYNSPILAIEGDGPYTYQARCSGCHKVPGVIK